MYDNYTLENEKICLKMCIIGLKCEYFASLNVDKSVKLTYNVMYI